jgi:hypothetical protein
MELAMVIPICVGAPSQRRRQRKLCGLSWQLKFQQGMACMLLIPYRR